jgi:adenosylmethionine-8-amino-7-oxononanoate aminotransferase
MTQLSQRFIKHSIPFAVKGGGIYLIDAYGKRHLNASSGATVILLMN